jgi:hypothetical protein
MTSRRSDLQLVCLPLTVLGIAYFAAVAGWAFFDFPGYYRTARQTVAMTGVAALVAGVGLIGFGLLAKQRGFSMLGIAVVLRGACDGILLLHLRLNWSRSVMLALLTSSVLACLVGLVIQMKERRRLSSSHRALP